MSLERVKTALYRYIYGSRDINDGYFHAIFLVLRLIGLNVFHENWTLNIISLYHCTSVVTYWIIVVINFYNKLTSPVGFEFPDDMGYTYIWAGLTTGLIPTYIVLTKRKALTQVYDWVFVEFYGWISSDEEKLAKYKKKSSRLMTWCKFAGFQVYSAGILPIFRPLSDGSRLPMYETATRNVLIDYTVPVLYTITYAGQALSIMCIAGMLFTTDAMFLLVSTHLSAQLFMLGEELEEAGHSGDCVRIQSTLNTFIDRHNAIQKCLAKLSYAYNPQSFVLPTLTIVFCTVSLLAFDGSVSSIPSLGLAVAHGLHLLNFCLPAQTVLEESETLFQRVMHCNWHTWPRAQQKTLLLIMLRLKTPMGVHCGLSGVFSFELFASILQTIYSLYNAGRRLA